MKSLTLLFFKICLILIDKEFFESVVAPQVMLQGSLGFVPRTDGFKLNPRLATRQST
jgi:hypothetical protein